MSGTSRHIVLSCQDSLQIRIADCRTDRICIRVFMTDRSEEHTSELQSHHDMVLCLLYSAILAFSFRPSHWPTISLFVIFSPIFCFQTHILLTVSANKCADLSIHYCHSMMLGSKILLQASLRRTSDLLTLVSFYIITDFSLLCKSKSCTEYSATTARYCSRIAQTVTSILFLFVADSRQRT